jgi:hypothetical protein
LVSACAGQGGDVVGALDGHPRAADVTGRLVEWDEDNVIAAREALLASGCGELRWGRAMPHSRTLTKARWWPISCFCAVSLAT